MTQNKKLLSGSTLVVLAILFVAVTFLSNALLRGARIDLTQGSIYSLSAGTYRTLKNIDEPVRLYYYFSDRATRSVPPLRTYAVRVREMLEEIAAASGGKVVLEVIDPVPFSEQEDRATEFGLQSVPVQAGESIFFGLAGTNSIGEQQAITFFQPDKEPFLEYDIVKMIHSLAQARQPVVGLLSGLPMQGDFDFQARRMGEPWAVVSQLRELFEMRPLQPDLSAIDADIDVLMLVHPKELPEDAVYAIDQFVLRGGRLAVFVDPHAEADPGPNDPTDPSAAMLAPKASNLPQLFASWGVTYDPTRFVADLGTALQVQIRAGQPPVRHLGILGLGPTNMSQDDAISAQLDVVHVASAGFFIGQDGSTTRIEPLLQSSPQSMAMPVDRLKFSQDPSSLLEGFAGGGEPFVIAGRIIGKVKTAFPDRSGDGHLAESAGEVNILLFADTDVLTDRLWVQRQNFFGQTLFSPIANNGDLINNGIDNLTGSNDLISIRGRASSNRPFTRVESLRRDSEMRFRDTAQRLESELNDTETKLRELQAGKSEDQMLILSAEQQLEIQRFQEQKLRIRKELREVRRQLDADIESLGARLRWINILAVPLLLIGFALLRAATRNSRRRPA